MEDLAGMDGRQLYSAAKEVSENLVLYMPRNTNTQQVSEALLLDGIYLEFSFNFFCEMKCLLVNCSFCLPAGVICIHLIEIIICKVSRKICLLQVLSLAGEGGYVEMEQSVLKTKVVALTAYFGELVNAA